MKEFILNKLSEIRNDYSICGIIDKQGRIYPLGLDTKRISTIFEIVRCCSIRKTSFCHTGGGIRKPKKRADILMRTFKSLEKDKMKNINPADYAPIMLAELAAAMKRTLFIPDNPTYNPRTVIGVAG